MVESPPNKIKHRDIEPTEPKWKLQNKTQQVKALKELREQPLDVEKLKALAALAKQIQGQRR